MFPQLHPVMHSVEGFVLDGKRYCTPGCAAFSASAEAKRLRGYLHEIRAFSRGALRAFVERALRTTQTMRELRNERAHLRGET